ncbi:MAG: Peptidase, M50 family [Candidatus Kaiserbacteria bacterium GW2011_GWB1_52_6]|uniref:Peptidase, M50 family n=1 Tax=Candidatus Kaiserbacteria bacterium GW2011_GWB1_52_6 TaxID=1618674 RepID=A0A0G1ZIG0_9BACT|nr:MAG: Peptidase, M50 family [Candidatus Kaiserbacteria bacterium GW2011_GWB1_52_6]
MLSTLFSNPLVFLLWAIGLVLAISIHEYAHARVADRLGDPTPRSQGRLTLDPRSHLDPLGTIALLFLGFGWGRPVMFDPYNLRSPRRDSALIALAGPASNLLFALILSLCTRFLPALSFIAPIFGVLILMNISLAIFNLVPVFPLDGEKILGGLLSPALYQEYQNIMRQYGTIILILLLLPIAGGTSPISALISPVISFVTNLLL